MLLPVGVESSRNGLARATFAILLLNAGIFALCVLQASGMSGFSLELVWSLPESVLETWALSPAHPHVWTFLTAPWVHLGLLHLAGNLLFLWVFGTAAEEILGWRALVGTYVLGGIASTAAQSAAAYAGMTPADLSYAGSSGAVIAVITAFAIRRHRARIRLWLLMVEVSVPAGAVLLLFVCWYGLLPWLTAGPDRPAGYWGHLGGAAAGLLVAMMLGLAPHGLIDYTLEDALRRIQEGRLKEGLDELHRLHRLAPEDTRIPLALADAYLKVWDTPSALIQYARAIQVEMKPGRPEGALAIWDQAAAAGVSLPPALALSLAAALSRSRTPTPDTVCRVVVLYEWVAASEDAGAAAVARRRLATPGA